MECHKSCSQDKFLVKKLNVKYCLNFTQSENKRRASEIIWTKHKGIILINVLIGGYFFKGYKSACSLLHEQKIGVYSKDDSKISHKH